MDVKAMLWATSVLLFLWGALALVTAILIVAEGGDESAANRGAKRVGIMWALATMTAILAAGWPS